MQNESSPTSSSASRQPEGNEQDENLSSWAKYLKNKYGGRSTGDYFQRKMNFQISQTNIKTQVAAPPPPLGLPRAVASRRRKTEEPDSVSAQLRARDRKQEVLTSSQKTRQAPPLLHLYSPWRAQEVNFLHDNENIPTLLSGIGSMPSSQYLSKQALVLKFGARGSQPGFFTWPRGENDPE